MASPRRPWRRVLLWGIAFLLFVQVLNLLMPARIAPVGPLNLLARGVIRSAAVLQATTDAVKNQVDIYFRNADAMRQLKQARRDLTQLQFEHEFALTFIEQRRIIDQLTGWTYKPWHGAVARVAFHDPMDRYNTAWLQLPPDANVRGQAVVTPQGLFGRVVQQAGRAAQVLLVNDVESAVDTISPTGVRAIVRGTGGRLGRLDLVPQYEPLTSGDVLVTTGRDAVYPAGISVAVVNDVERSSEQLYLTAAVRFFVDVAAADWVRTVPAPNVLP